MSDHDLPIKKGKCPNCGKPIVFKERFENITKTGPSSGAGFIVQMNPCSHCDYVPTSYEVRNPPE